MKNKILLALISLISTFTFSQNIDLQISRINKIKSNIKNNIELLKKVETFKDETGSRYVYKEGNEIKLITVEFFDNKKPSNIIRKNVEWYFLNEKLIYAQQIWTDLSTNKVIDQQTSYLNGEQMLAWIDTSGSKVAKDSDKFIQMETELVKYGKELIAKSK